MTQTTLHIDADPAPDVQLVHTDAVNEANRLSNEINAKQGYAMHAMKKAPTPKLTRDRASFWLGVEITVAAVFVLCAVENSLRELAKTMLPKGVR